MMGLDLTFLNWDIISKFVLGGVGADILWGAQSQERLECHTVNDARVGQRGDDTLSYGKRIARSRARGQAAPHLSES